MAKSRQTNLNLDDFPDSDYAAELRRGVSHRPFAPVIEAEYLRTHLERVHLRVRIWFTMTAMATVLFAFLQLQDHGVWAIASLLQAAVQTPLALLMLVIVWTPCYHRLFMPLSGILTAIIIASLTFINAEHIVQGNVEEIAMLAINVFSVFFFGGLLFASAVIASVALMISFVLAALFLQMPQKLAIVGFLLSLLNTGMAAVVCRDIEIALRRNFLESVLIRELVARDGLTGVMNRRAFDEHLLRVWQQSLRDKRTITLMIIDIDHFKAFNDHRGHQAGDAALRKVAQALQNFARRPLDLAARYGGEEFAIILYDFVPAQLNLMAEQVREAIETMQIEHGAAGAGPVVTVSIGVAIVQPALDRTIPGAIQLADEALYEAKRLGRNRVVVRGGEHYKTMQTGVFGALKLSRRS